MKFLILALIFSGPQNSTKPIINGVYQGLGQLNIIADSTHTIGYFQNYRNNYSVSTIFFFYGKRLKKKDRLVYLIKTFYPGENDTITGKIYIIDREEIFVTLNTIPPGNVFSIEGTKAKFEIIEPKRWTNMGFVNKAKVFIKRGINDMSKSNVYIIKGDCVAILECKDSFSKIEYIGRTRNTVGWVLSSAIKQLKEN